ncbi:MAG: hypothetical protein JNL84_09565 [Candidatus Accumulibacter sp.]|nr:hypothetical protein [Accumulibacter sp.]
MLNLAAALAPFRSKAKEVQDQQPLVDQSVTGKPGAAALCLVGEDDIRAPMPAVGVTPMPADDFIETQRIG